MPGALAVKQYIVLLYPNEGGPQRARINLYCHDGHRLYLIFEDPPVGTNSFNEDTKTGLAYQPSETYPWYVDLLRNEGPLHVTFATEQTPVRYALQTGGEQVGEGEGGV